MVPAVKFKTNRFVEVDFCQNAAKDWLGGFAEMCAFFAVLNVVSECSTEGEFPKPNHSTEHVADVPCEGGALHISKRLILKERNKTVTALFVAVPIEPIAPNTEVSVIAKFDSAALATKRNLWWLLTFDSNCGGENPDWLVERRFPFLDFLLFRRGRLFADSCIVNEG
jgi:hypothetical protein